ncbi:unnamed protein product [Trichobilharzia regenti]|nr:unnamed protein product [Trichobilharzia regenti]
MDTPNVVHSLTDLLMNSTSPPFQKLEEEEVHHQEHQRFSAFGVPVKTTRDSLSSNPTSNYFHRQHDTMIFNRTKPPLTTTTPTNSVSCNSSHDTVNPKTTSPPIWRPYLD